VQEKKACEWTEKDVVEYPNRIQLPGLN